MTKERRDELRQLDTRLASAPWSFSEGADDGTMDVIHGDEEAPTTIAEGMCEQDADGICEMRNALPELLDAVDRLERELAEARGRIVKLEEENARLEYDLDCEIAKPRGAE